MNQISLLKDILQKFLEKTCCDYDLPTSNTIEKWSKLSDSFLDFNKNPSEQPINQESSFVSSKATICKGEGLFKKQSSISDKNDLENDKNDNQTDNLEMKTVSNDENTPLNKDKIESPETNDDLDSRSKYYVLSKTVNFLQKALEAESFEYLNLNSYFLSTFILEMISANEMMLKCVAVSHFIHLIMESFSNESHPSLNDIYNMVNTKQCVLNPHSTSIFSEEQLKNSFLNNFKKILKLRAKSHVSFTKLAKSFAYLIWQKPLFLESLVVLLKEMMIITVHKTNTFLDKDFMIKLVLQIWSEPRRDLLKLLAETLNRTIELYEIKENKLEVNNYKPNITGFNEERKLLLSNKISMISGNKNENVWVSLILNISEKECFERLENLSKDEISFLEEENITLTTMTTPPLTFQSSNILPISNKEKKFSVQEWRKTNSIVIKLKEIKDLMNYNSEKMNFAFSIEKQKIININEFKENIIPVPREERFNSGNKVERIEIIDRTRDKSRSRSPMIYYNQQNPPYCYDSRLKTITTITSGTYHNANPVIIDNRVRRHYTTNHLPTISNNLFSFN